MTLEYCSFSDSSVLITSSFRALKKVSLFMTCFNNLYKKIFLQANTRVSELELGPRASRRLHIVTVLEDSFIIQKKTTF